jgi:SOS-response transcriptional repressor LexA
VQARGDSMEPMIHDGDLVLAEKTTASNGSIAVVIHDDTAKIKKVLKNDHEVILQSLNPQYTPIVVKHRDDLSVAGVVRGVIRKFTDLSNKKSRP